MLYSSSWAVVTGYECEQKTNSMTTGAMIKFIREMSPSNAQQFEVKKHMKMPCSCAPFPRSVILYIHYVTTDQTHLTACMLAPPSFCFGFICLFVMCCVSVSFCCWRWVNEALREVFSGKEPISCSLRTADVEMRALWRHHRGFKAKSQVIFHLHFELQFPSIQAIPHEAEPNRNWSPSNFCVEFNKIVIPFPFLPLLSHNFPCKTTTF